MILTGSRNILSVFRRISVRRGLVWRSTKSTVGRRSLIEIVGKLMIEFRNVGVMQNLYMLP
jgi:hypothetical protein